MALDSKEEEGFLVFSECNVRQVNIGFSGFWDENITFVKSIKFSSDPGGGSFIILSFYFC